MKLLTIAVPCYNSEAYLEKCVDSLLPGGERVEILLVNDGSSDRTAEIADSYAKQYPSIVRVIHQENKGHGGAVNTGLREASGIYFKVVDSDDSVSLDAYHKILDTLENLVLDGKSVDMLISNYIYDKVGVRKKKVISYRRAFPQNEVFTWDKVGFLHKGQYILMHSVIYRTRVLKECGLKLPEHTFYVDNLFVYIPLPYVKNLYYIDVIFYRYFIGRADQSVNEANMIKRIDQQIRVTKAIIDAYSLRKLPDKKLRNYMKSYMEIMMTVSSVFLICSGTPENLAKKEELWAYLKTKDPLLYRKIRRGIMGQTMNLPGPTGRKISIAAYRATQHFYGFN
ncbi:glycosyltransferase family 2 protein [Hominifimenecus sp. rT4P-3]|uniref:glycosyltransferase family 2 protein n=1 Tax=Hominifimenecus sp. rT4P-3 TaxID=3242979 RepID=UPI003DA50B96